MAITYFFILNADTDYILNTTPDDIDTSSFASQPDSGIEEPLGDLGVDGASVKSPENGAISVADIQELRRQFSQPHDETSTTGTASEVSDFDSVEGSSSLDTDDDGISAHHVNDSNTSGVITHASSTDELDRDDTEQDMIAKDSQEECDKNEGVDEGFPIDPVVCVGFPIVHCARVMGSFLLSGKSGEILSDRAVRVSVKSLALNCLAAILKIKPSVFLMRVLTEAEDHNSDDEVNQQLIREVMLFEGHHDPTIRGSLALLLANFLRSSLLLSR